MEKTIAAVSTGPAPGGLGVVRVSGAQAFEIADRVFRGIGGKTLREMRGYTARLGAAWWGGEKLDDVVALCFRAPKSYTGEDVVELSCHGGLFVCRRILNALFQAGAEPAGPGEFTRRAFLNGKLDLTQAEAVMALISAGGEQAARAAVSAGGGALSRRIAQVRDQLSVLAAHLAAWADFPEEDVPAIGEEELSRGLAVAIGDLEDLLSGYERGRALREGVDAAIIGSPNTGKSTLMNLLAGRQRSIVTELPGTTRDVVEEQVELAGVPLRLADTAGLRDSQDPVERLGVAAAQEQLRSAQLVLAVFDRSRPLTEEELARLDELDPARTVAVLNKADLPVGVDETVLRTRFPYAAALSAKSGHGLRELEEQVGTLLGTVGYQVNDAALFTQRQHRDAQLALAALRQAQRARQQGMTLDAVTVCIDDALNALYALTGQRASDQVIDRVFENFCVGK